MSGQTDFERSPSVIPSTGKESASTGSNSGNQNSGNQRSDALSKVLNAGLGKSIAGKK